MRLNIIKGFAPLMLVGALLIGCDKEEILNDNIVYVNINQHNVASATITHIPDAAGVSDLNLEFRVHTTKPIDQDITVSMAIDNSLVATYNAENQTELGEIAPSALMFSKTSLVIPRGEYESSEPTMVTIVDPDAIADGEYVVPIRVMQVSANSGQVSSNRSIIYIRVKAFSPIIDSTPGAVTDGVTIDRTGWEISLEPVDGTPLYGSVGDPSVLIDGATNNFRTSVYSNTGSFNIVVNMNALHSFDVIKMAPLNNGYPNPYVNYLATSVDGVAWTVVNDERVSIEQTLYDGYQYIKLYKTMVDVQYVKVGLTTGGTFYGCNELFFILRP